MNEPKPDAELVHVVESEEGRSLGKLFEGSKYKKYGRFVFAALGSIPWIGGLIGASAALNAEFEQGQVNELMKRWLEELLAGTPDDGTRGGLIDGHRCVAA